MPAVATTPSRPSDSLRDSRSLRLGVAGALALYVGMVLVWVFGVPLFAPADERAHVDYAWQVAHGHLPVAGTEFTAEFPQLDQVSYVQHVSNHPPLYYVVTGPILRLADAAGHPAVGLYTLRLLNAAVTALTILVIGRLAAVVTTGAPRRARIACVVIACALTAVNPALVAASGAIQNDALAVLLTAVVSLVVAKAARTGLDRRTVALVALLCTLGMLTRMTFLTVAFIAIAAVGALSLWPDLRLRRPDRRAWTLGIGRALTIAATILAGSGWFMLLNLHRYGDITGGSAVYSMPSVEARHLAPGASHGPLLYLLNPHTWWVQLKQLVGPVPSIAHGTPTFVVMAIVLLAILLAGVAAALTHGAPRLLDRTGAWTMVGLGLVLLAAIAKLADHVTHRGGENLRYLLDGLGVWAIGVAALLLALRRMAPLAAALVVGMGAVGTVCYAAGIVLRRDGISGVSALRALRDSLSNSIVPADTVWVVGALAAAVIGLAAVVAAVVRAGKMGA